MITNNLSPVYYKPLQTKPTLQQNKNPRTTSPNFNGYFDWLKNYDKDACLNDKIITPSTLQRPGVRTSTAKHLDKVYNNYKDSLQEIRIEDINNAINHIKTSTNYTENEILTTMQQITQFGNINSLKTIEKTFKKENIGDIIHFDIIDSREDNFGLNTSLDYLITEKNIINMQSPAELGYKHNIAIFLDDNKLQQLEKLKNENHDVFTGVTMNPRARYFILSGFNNGINFLNRNKNLEKTTRKLLEQKNIDEEIIQRANQLGLNPIIIKNTNKPTIENIYKQLQPEQISKQELDAIIDATLIYRIEDPKDRIEFKEPVTQYLEDNLLVYTPESMAKSLVSMNHKINKIAQKYNKTDKDIVYIIPNYTKSYSLINHQYQLVNNIEKNKFIPLSKIEKQLKNKQLQNKLFVILDDCSISGSSLKHKLLALYYNKDTLNKNNCNIIVAPIYATEESMKTINKLITYKNRSNNDVLIYDKIRNITWDKNINILDKHKLNKILGVTCFEDGQKEKPCVIFPYMAPDNNTEFAANIAAFHNISYRNGHSNSDNKMISNIKSYTKDCENISDIANKLLNNKPL